MKKLFLVLLVAIFFAVPFVFARLAHAEKGHEHGVIRHGVMHGEQKDLEDVGNKICPVSGEEINDDTKTTYAYKGKIYNFCCSMCVDEFKKDPQKYINKIEELQEGKETEELQERKEEKGDE